MWEIKETSPNRDLAHGHTIVGASAVPLTNLTLKFNRGILLRTPGGGDLVPNTDIVWIGGASVTADSDLGTGGIPLPPGSSVEIPVEDPSKLYAISLSEDQDLAWLGV